MHCHNKNLMIQWGGKGVNHISRYSSGLFRVTFMAICTAILWQIESRAAEAHPTNPEPKLIAIRQEASPMEELAAGESRHHIFLGTGELLLLERDAKGSRRIVIFRR